MSEVGKLFETAQQEGALSTAAMNTLAVVDVGANIQNALGVTALDVQASEVVLVTQLIDDSGSIRFAGNTQVVRDGHNTVITALKESKQVAGILAHTRYLNGLLLYPYCPIDQAEMMDQHNYNPNGGTPLYDQTVIILGTVIAKAQEFADNGVPVRTVTLIVTDSNDEHSVKISRPSQIEPLISNMLMQENHIVAAMGIDDGTTPFREIFREMGVRDEWILTPQDTHKDIRAAFQLFSSSARTASQSAATFSQTALGGFTQ